MVLPLFAAFTQTLFMLLLGGMAVFLILLVLVQRGRGGGLAGALGGMGGSSAFGAKAGDVFTKITIGTATIWIVLCIAAARLTPSNQSRVNVNVSVPADTSGLEISNASDTEETTVEEGEAGATEGDGADVAAEPAGETAPESTTEAESAASDETDSGEEAK